jgi:hypothetical protein
VCSDKVSTLTQSMGKSFPGRLSIRRNAFSDGSVFYLDYTRSASFNITLLDPEIETIVATRISTACITSKKYIAYHQESLV